MIGDGGGVCVRCPRRSFLRRAARSTASYTNAVWEKCVSTDLRVDAGGLGVFAGRVQNGSLTFPGLDRSFAKPASSDVFSCDSGFPCDDVSPAGRQPVDGSADDEPFGGRTGTFTDPRRRAHRARAKVDKPGRADPGTCCPGQRPGNRSVISCSTQPLPSGSANEAKEE
ncbi:beta-1,3-glucanase family protein [Streptomyces chengbuensis]|uniref:beta-1,3-glucanase family protein n=1 Tax=Streptomyces chengbuensis TaxID=3053466 RepID=UPI00339DF8CE